MITATELKPNTVIKLSNELWRVIAAENKKGTAKTGMMVFAKLKNISTGNITEHRLAPDDKLEDLELEVRKMNYMYSDGKMFYFMDDETYEQISLSKELIGNAANFLNEEDTTHVEFYNDTPIGIIFPEEIEIEVKSTGSGIKGEGENIYKIAILKNDMEVLVPQFVLPGEKIIINTETGEYIERVKKTK